MEGTMDASGNRWVAAWPLLEVLLPGATLFTLLVWLSWRLVRVGFGDVRQYTFAQAGRSGSMAAHAPRDWRSCTCSAGACRCLVAITRRLRQCCVKLLRPGMALPGAA